MADDYVQEVLECWRAEQASGGSVENLPVRFVVEASALTDEQLRGIAEAWGLRAKVSPLFEPNDELARFRVLEIERVSRPDRADLFEVAHQLQRQTGAQTVEPDLGTDYYRDEEPPPAVGAPESADWAFWCWADRKPGDRDWAIAKTKVREAWDYSRANGRPAQGQGIAVFQPDTGVVANHTELPLNCQLNRGAANFVEPGTTAEDPRTGGGNPGHGTGTGSVVASPEGGLMTGSAPLATLVPIRCIKRVAVFDQSPVAKAIDHARRNGAHVITMSLGGVMSSALHAAVQKAVKDNVIVLAAAGNCVGEVVWPARYREALAVGGVNDRFEPWRGSCRGSAVDISGPAEFVLRADGNDLNVPPSRVDGGQGTSFATALTAGIAALWMAHHGRAELLNMLPSGWTLQELFRRCLQKTAQTAVPPEFDTSEMGAGVVDALALLRLDPRSVTVPDSGAMAGEPEDADEVKVLVHRAFGRSGLEAAESALANRQYAPELACAAFDRLRSARTLRAKVESMPPPMLSPSVRRQLDGPLGRSP